MSEIDCIIDIKCLAYKPAPVFVVRDLAQVHFTSTPQYVALSHVLLVFSACINSFVQLLILGSLSGSQS